MENLILRKAVADDLCEIISFYDRVIDDTPDMDEHARWKKGLHPTENGIRAYVEEGNMYICIMDGEHVPLADGAESGTGKIAAAMAVTMYQGEDYHEIEWAEKAEDDEVAVIHVLAVSPFQQGKGIGRWMVREAISLAESNGMKSVRLDALASNTPAHALYRSLGFEYRGKQHLYADNTGWTDFLFFELV